MAPRLTNTTRSSSVKPKRGLRDVVHCDAQDAYIKIKGEATPDWSRAARWPQGAPTTKRDGGQSGGRAAGCPPALTASGRGRWSFQRSKVPA